MKLSATGITLGEYDFYQHMSREKLCAKRLHGLNSNPDFSIPSWALTPLQLPLLSWPGGGALSAAGQAPFFLKSSSPAENFSAKDYHS
jgi:hypothetical protein